MVLKYIITRMLMVKVIIIVIRAALIVDGVTTISSVIAKYFKYMKRHTKFPISIAMHAIFCSLGSRKFDCGISTKLTIYN